MKLVLIVILIALGADYILTLIIVRMFRDVLKTRDLLVEQLAEIFEFLLIGAEKGEHDDGHNELHREDVGESGDERRDS